MNNKKVIYLSLGLAFLIVLSVVLKQEKSVASVNGEKISEKHLHELLVSQYGSDGVNKLITDKIIEQEMKKKKLNVSDEELAEEMADYVDTYGGEEAFQEILNSSGVDLSSIEKNMKTYLATKKLIEPRITITEDEMKDYFEENKDSYGQEEQVQASHILVGDEATAKEVIKKLNAGEDFATLAKSYSSDESSSPSGGELGYFGRGEMVQEFEDAAFSLDVGKISDPIKSEYGYHVIKVTDKKAGKAANFDDVKEEIKAAILDSKLESEYASWLDEKYKEYEIKNYFNS
ncbi:foldase [Cytobacillus depressus]|uniref:Foldase protein PrsA n=1 Tax=Cytobacillus depressus TaxID=1602942 RepID=A0A6L3V2Q3_9BACI|nr:peptidylprolyl isomerase [Cytobacillus depressus]KAB2330507.1 foldase [Cytobacillus depressus]